MRIRASVGMRWGLTCSNYFSLKQTRTGIASGTEGASGTNWDHSDTRIVPALALAHYNSTDERYGGYRRPFPMCGRFTLRTPLKDVVELFELAHYSPSEPGEWARFNIAPSQQIAVVR